MIDQSFRKILPSLAKPLVTFYKKLGISANQLSVAGFIFAVLAAIAVSTKFFLLAVILWWIGRLFDGTDGILARETDTSTLFGAYLDIVLDMASYSMMILGFYMAFPNLAFGWLLCLLLYVLCITSALAMGDIQNQLEKSGTIKIETDNRGLKLANGLAEAGETGIAYTLFLLFPNLITVLMTCWLIILSITVIARTLLVRKMCN